MFNVLSSPLNHTQTNQNKLLPLTHRGDFENKKNINQYKNINIYSRTTLKNINKNTNITNQLVNRSINKNLGRGEIASFHYLL